MIDALSQLTFRVLDAPRARITCCTAVPLIIRVKYTLAMAEFGFIVESAKKLNLNFKKLLTLHYDDYDGFDARHCHFRKYCQILFACQTTHST